MSRMPSSNCVQANNRTGSWDASLSRKLSYTPTAAGTTLPLTSRWESSCFWPFPGLQLLKAEEGTV